MSAACCARPRSAITASPPSADSGRGPHHPGERTADRRLRKLRELSQPLGGLLGSSGQRSLEVTRRRRRTDPAYGPASRHHRAYPPDDRTIDPDRRAPRQPARHRGAGDPAAGHRPDSGAGAGSAGPDRTQADPGQDRQDGIPHGRFVGVAGSGPAGPGAGRFGSADERGVRRRCLMSSRSRYWSPAAT